MPWSAGWSWRRSGCCHQERCDIFYGVSVYGCIMLCVLGGVSAVVGKHSGPQQLGGGKGLFDVHFQVPVHRRESQDRDWSKR